MGHSVSAFYKVLKIHITSQNRIISTPQNMNLFSLFLVTITLAALIASAQESFNYAVSQSVQQISSNERYLGICMGVSMGVLAFCAVYKLWVYCCIRKQVTNAIKKNTDDEYGLDEPLRMYGATSMNQV